MSRFFTPQQIILSKYSLREKDKRDGPLYNSPNLFSYFVGFVLRNIAKVGRSIDLAVSVRAATKGLKQSLFEGKTYSPSFFR